jgi:hypothetical protein
MTIASTSIVVVTVENGKPVASPDPVVVTQENTLLVFYVDTKGYAFPTTGAIAIKPCPPQQGELAHQKSAVPTDADIVNNFPYPAWSTSASSVAFFDARSSMGDFCYNITVIDLNDGSRLESDPAIRNTQIGEP